MKLKMREVLSIFILLSICEAGQAVAPQAVRENNSAIEELSQENNYKAYQRFIDALSIEPFNLAIRMNLGLAFELNKEEDKALKEYLAVDRANPPEAELQFAARFNAARILAKQGHIDQALNYYQKALEIDPESKEVKTNIELLWQAQQSQQGKGQQNQNQNQGGEGQNQQQSQNQDQQQDQPQPNPGSQQEQKSNQQPKPFDSRELTKDDVRKILEEIVNQEQQIRAKEYSKDHKEKARDKDW